ncbi:MAG: hypothetical protein PWR17_451 [Candidatus Methanomethylophilaceae archaeon]|nr:hypothetical protein [Candidatus Methanomethylophilaceae archaeon]
MRVSKTYSDYRQKSQTPEAFIYEEDSAMEIIQHTHGRQIYSYIYSLDDGRGQKLVGPAGFEPATSAMSRRRHNP